MADNSHLRLVSSIEQFTSSATSSLKSGDGGGTYDDMEARVKMLEYRADQTEKLLTRMDGKLDGLGKDLAEVKGRVNAMPSTWQLIGLVVALLGLAFVILKLTVPGSP